jgi:hypothetical protein
MIHSAFAIALVTGGVMNAPAPASAQEIVPINAGAYDALSQGNQMIVDAIYESQLSSPNSLAGGLLMTTDDIAALLDGETGLGKAYQDLYTQGLVGHSNLGLAVSSYQRQLHAAALPVPATGQPEGTGIPAGTTTGQSEITGIPAGTPTGIPAGVPQGDGQVTSLDGFGDNAGPHGFGAEGAAFGAEAAGFGKSGAGFGDDGSTFGAGASAFGPTASSYGGEGAAYGARGSDFGGNGSSSNSGLGSSGSPSSSSGGSSSLGSSSAAAGPGNSSRGGGSSSRGKR